MKYVLGTFIWVGVLTIVTILSFNYFRTDRVIEQVQIVQQKIKAVDEKIQDQLPVPTSDAKEDRVQ